MPRPSREAAARLRVGLGVQKAPFGRGRRCYAVFLLDLESRDAISISTAPTNISSSNNELQFAGSLTIIEGLSLSALQKSGWILLGNR